MHELIRSLEENPFPLESCWLVAVIAGAVAIFMLWRMSRALPLQNLIIIAVALLAGEGLMDWILVINHWTLVEVDYPWRYVGGAALLWLALVLLFRGLTQVIVEPWRRERFIGLWILGLSSLFTGMFQYAWLAFNPTQMDPNLSAVPQDQAASQDQAQIIALVRGVATLAFLAALTPWLISKKPGGKKSRSKKSKALKDAGETKESKLAQEPENKAEHHAQEQASGKGEVETDRPA